MCIFLNGAGIMILIYVDDLLIAGKSKNDCQTTADQLAQHFEIRAMGDVYEYLGIRIFRNREKRQIFMTQEAYATKILHKFGMQNLKPAAQPWKSDLTIPSTWTVHSDEQKSYIKQTGSLNYLSAGSRPDITQTINKLREANAGPSKQHLEALKHLWRYLSGCPALDIVLGGKYNPRDLQLHVFADASFASELGTRLSIGGQVVFLAGAPIYWKSKKHSLVFMRSTESEFCDLTLAGIPALSIAKLLRELGFHQSLPVVMFTDSLNAKATVLNPLNTARTRHIDTQYKWITDPTSKGYSKLEHVRTTSMVADGLTKPLLKEGHQNFVRMLCLQMRLW
ncbi:Uu.00g136130.m01.CDS01 [Anthostomella pinea]|uniref:Uu.00g136130.m01.CDS01 n=1 Tax=Anthostomella pinea TaxID=933095 RepID=A0AAI8VP93_9PEZI|nr:Uu.00g136130.m01.CDS01 [Anthostomella pinea]